MGYIKLNQFLENAGREIYESFTKLKEQGMEYLIIDLRDNGGGLLGEAINIIDLFVGQDIAVVETKGKIDEMNRIYKTRNPATDANIPIVVLVNEHSASASEIVSGTCRTSIARSSSGKNRSAKAWFRKSIPWITTPA